jgi:5'-nucleotidase
MPAPQLRRQKTLLVPTAKACISGQHNPSMAPKELQRTSRIRSRSGPRCQFNSTTSSWVYLGLLFLTCTTCSTSTVNALRILLSNDDGLDQPGIQALRSRLQQDGHDVHVYAPASDNTGLSASIFTSVPFTPLADQQTIVQAPPASAVLAGLSLMSMMQQQDAFPADTGTGTSSSSTSMGLPDVVLVGISDGFATGPQMLHSSSVGAALTALGKGIPTITVSGLATAPDVTPDVYYQNVADFTARLLTEWFKAIPMGQIPPGSGLKVAYPALLPENVNGVQLAATGKDAPLSLGYEPSLSDPNFWQVAPVLNPNALSSDSEAAIVDAGYVSVLPISNSMFLPERAFHVPYILQLRRVVNTMEP